MSPRSPRCSPGMPGDDAARADRVPGTIAIAAFFRTRDFLARASRLVLTRANGQPALGYYVRTDDNGDVLTAGGLLVLDVRFDGIAGITRFGDLRLFTLLELPRTLT